MKNFLLLFAFLSFNLFAQTSVSGDVSGTWTLAGSPYNVTGDLTILDAQTLTIEPGVTVNFTGYYKLTVLGSISALGTASDSIFFTTPDTAIGWNGIRFTNTPSTNDSSIFTYCKIEGGKTPATGTGDIGYGGGIFIRGFGKIRFSSCLFQYNKARWGGAISARDYASITIENSTFRLNYAQFSGAAIRLHDYCDALIRFNEIYGNSVSSGGAGFYFYRSNPYVYNNLVYNNTATSNGAAMNMDNSSPIVVNNLMVNNSSGNGGAIYITTLSQAKFNNNTIANNTANNGGAVYINLSSAPTFTNTIIWGNTASFGTQVYIANDNSDPNFIYSLIQHGTIGFYGNGSGGNYNGTYQNNVEVDPLFTGSGNHPFSISQNSPALDAGTPDTTGLYLPSIDLAGGLRVDSNAIDMGAYEYQTFIPVELISFTASVNNNSVTLNWMTATETNNKGFEIERLKDYSASGKKLQSWEKVGFINGNGTTTEVSLYSFHDKDVSAGKYIYRLIQIDYDGTATELKQAEIEITAPAEFALLQNYPNPFNPVTNFVFRVSSFEFVSLKVYDILGNEAASLVNEVKEPGEYEIEWNASSLSSGVYFYQLKAGSFSSTKKLILMK